MFLIAVNISGTTKSSSSKNRSILKIKSDENYWDFGPYGGIIKTSSKFGNFFSCTSGSNHKPKDFLSSKNGRYLINFIQSSGAVLWFAAHPTEIPSP